MRAGEGREHTTNQSNESFPSITQIWVMEGKLSLDWLVVCSLPSPARIFYGGGFKIPHPNPHDNSFNKMAIKKNKKFANMPSLDDCQRCPQLRYRRGDGQR